jgi:hypothetical protein
MFFYVEWSQKIVIYVVRLFREFFGGEGGSFGRFFEAPSSLNEALGKRFDLEDP